jgi:hypothetical protein
LAGFPSSLAHLHSNDVLQLQKGALSARSDDTKSLKSVIIDWITPHGESLSPPIAQNAKLDRGYNHEVTGALLCPTGLDWSDPEFRISALSVLTTNKSHPLE